ncbi:hypothetical protein ACFWGC_13115 [Cytobacillus pseudoceanisediminis]|uniref:hypothetical protein n=1 Tax=Cytobacillus pseudoceanisediminis TaxID=3051614 RepID=UPI0036473BE9
MTSGLGGLVSAYAAVTAGQKAFNTTIGEAAKYEQSSIMISAMLNDKKLGQDYMKLVDRFSVDSPILDSQGMLANSKSFLTASKDMKQLEKMWSLAERMAAIDPYQGLEGSVFALRELFSGDAISMVRRFEMPRKIMNEIKNMDLEGQLSALDKYFNSIGMTQKLIDDMGGTTLGVWAQIKEQTNVILRTMGGPALGKVKTFLNTIKSEMVSVKQVMADRNLFTPEEFRERYAKALKFEQFQQLGARIIENVTTGFINGVSAVAKWADAITSSDGWKKANSLSAKIGILFDDFWKAFDTWLNSKGGQKKIKQVSETLTQMLAIAIETSSGPILGAARDIGTAIGEGVIKGASSYVANNWASVITSSIKEGPIGQVFQAPGRAATGFMDKLTHGQFSKAVEKGRKGKSHASGLTRVPYDGYQATLHKNERVLTPEESKAYNNGGGGNTFNFHVNMSGIGTNMEEAADQLLRIFAKKIEAAGGAGA